MASSAQPNGLLSQQADEQLATHKLLRATLDASMDMIQVFEAVRNQQGDIIDFTWILNNHASQKIYGDVVGKSLLQRQPGVVEEGIFEAFKQVVETGLPQQYEKQYVHEQFDGWFYQSVVKLDDGVATTTSDITDRKKAEGELRQSKTLLQNIIDAPTIGIAVYKAVRNERGQIIDFTHEYINRASLNLLGGEDFTGKLFTDHGENALVQLPQFIQVMESGKGNRYVREADLRGQKVWFAITNTLLDSERLVHTWEDITERRKTDEEILRLNDELAQKATDKYRILFATIDEGFALLELLFDQRGQIADLIYREANAAFEQHTGLAQANGKRASEVFPQIEQGWFEAMRRVHQTGVPERTEGYNTDTQRWLTTHYSRVGDLGSPFIAAVFQDITERKQREQHQAFLLHFSDALRAEPDADAIANRALHLLAGHLQLDRCYVGVYQLAEDQAVFPYQVGNDRVPPMPQEGVRLSDFPQALRVTFDETVVITDFQTTEGLSDVDKRNFDALGFGALVVATVRKGEKNPYWAICAVSAGPRRWTSLEIQLVEEVTERTWAAVERAKAEAALRASQKRFESIANLVPDLLWDSAPDGATNWYNQRWLAYTGQRFEEAIGRGWTEAIHPEDREASAKRYNEAVKAGTSLRQEHRIRRHDGAYRWFVVSASPLTDQTGQVVKMYGAATDIHDRKRLEASLLEADRRKDEFLAMLAHELRNPMATLHNTLLLLELTRGQDETLPLERALAMMSREVIHLNRMVDDLLDISRISQGKIHLKKDRLDLAGLLREALEVTRYQISSQGHRLTSQLPTEPIWVDGDRTRLTQVVRNLVTNAAKYTPHGGQIRVTLEKENRQAVLRIRDDGIGIAADQLQAIFEVFVQVSSSLDRPQGGLGLGLSVVKRLVELHDGQVSVQSAGLGQGSEFTISLPLLSDVPASMASAAGGQGVAKQAARILVVDDNADLAQTTAMLLRVKNYEAHTCLSGSEALKVVVSLQPDAVLLDLGMPGMDGYETCRRLRSLDWGQQGVIVALSGYGQEEDKQRTLAGGFDGHLVKPVHLQTLTALLDKLLKGQASGK